MESSRVRLAGRGSLSNASGRFDLARVPDEPPTEGPPTRVEEERPRGVLSRNASPDVGFDRSVNPYRGCEHGCVYCYARPTHALLGLSPGLDFETRITAKAGAAQVLRRELGARGYEPRPLALGTVTDAYQPAERDRGLSRAVLEVLSDCGHPVIVFTKGTLVERDLDVLAPMAERGLARLCVSVTTLDAGLCRRLEPRAPAPERRLATIRAAAEAGVPVRLMASPIIPALTDHELERILEAGAKAGATGASVIPLRLPMEVAGLFREWLEAHVPDRAERVMGRVREFHGGRDYDSRFGHRMTGQGVWATLLRRRVEVTRRRLGLAERMPELRTDLFVPPGGQMRLL
jgi:DNA repair photolyase